MKKWLPNLALLVLLLAGSVSAMAESPIILTLSGDFGEGKGGIRTLSLEQLNAFPQREIRTETPWTDGVIVYRGPLLRDVLQWANANGQHLEALAINDYTVTIPVSDAYQYDVILATHKMDVPMTVRTKGPIWVIYPWQEKTELQTETYYSRSIWQLKAIEVR